MKWSSVASFRICHLVVHKETPSDALFTLKGVSPTFSVVVPATVSMQVVFQKFLRNHLGHEPNSPEERCHVLVRSLSPTVILSRDCLLCESGVKNGEQLEGDDSEFA